MQQYFCKDLESDIIQLPEATARHIAGVLRMRVGDTFYLCDGMGKRVIATILEMSKKNVTVRLSDIQSYPKVEKRIALGIAFTKNPSRMEWLLEKATEIGIQDIYPLDCKRGEHGKIKEERWNNILIAAMCQSQQVYLPKLHSLTSIKEVLEIHTKDTKLVAHCIATEPKHELAILPIHNSSLILVGPEGDFTHEEVDLCLQQGTLPVSLGATRLRTETAGLVAVTLLKNK
jgi:16S rRNA (uracil1498-N3)-methyltransferase